MFTASDEGYSRNASCTLDLIDTFLFLYSDNERSLQYSPGKNRLLQVVVDG
jgi:hypothetical protein